MNTAYDSDDDDVPDASELLDFELIAKSQPEKGRGVWLWVVLILILAGGGWAGWMYMQDQQEIANAKAGGVPLIMAPQFKIKDRPQDPGGMKVPDRDKSIYDRMNGTGSTLASGGVEHLLPPPETPISPPHDAVQAKPQPVVPVPPMPAASAPALKPAPAVNVTDKHQQTPTSLAPAPTAKPVAPPTPPTAKVVAVKPAVKPTSQAPKPMLKIKASAPAGLGYKIQLSAVRTEQAAKGEWARLAKKHPDILANLKAVIQRADLGTKGIFYRVRGGWLATRGEAKTICAELKRRNVGCIIVKP